MVTDQSAPQNLKMKKKDEYRVIYHGSTIAIWNICPAWPRDYKTFLMLNSTEHGIYSAH